MSTKNKNQNKQSKKNLPNSGGFSEVLLLCTDIVSRVGIPGFLVIAIVSFTIFFSSKDQKEQLIDRWLLLNNNSNLQTLTICVIVFSIIIYGILYYTFKRIRKLDREEIDRLSEYKTKYQELELNQKLKSSN